MKGERPPYNGDPLMKHAGGNAHPPPTWHKMPLLPTLPTPCGKECRQTPLLPTLPTLPTFWGKYPPAHLAQNATIADLADILWEKMPANTAIADFGDIAGILREMHPRLCCPK